MTIVEYSLDTALGLLQTCQARANPFLGQPKSTAVFHDEPCLGFYVSLGLLVLSAPGTLPSYNST